MKNNMVEQNIMKILNETMKNINIPQVPTQNMFGLGNMKKYIFIIIGLLFMSGFGFGLMIGLLF